MLPDSKTQNLVPVDYIQSLSHPDMLRLVREIDDPTILRQIAGIRFGLEASMENESITEPFVRWPVINKDFHPWLPVLLAKVAKAELENQLKEPLIVLAIPRSATPYMHPIIEEQIFPGAFFPWVMKEDQLELYGIKPHNAHRLPVPSYVHGRDPQTHLRNTQDILFFHPELYERKTVLILDDALAEGVSAITISRFLKEQLKARTVLFATPMAKIMQGGESNIAHDGSIDSADVIIHVTRVHGFRQSVEFYSQRS